MSRPATGAGIVLAAGLSSRMGAPKALLARADGRTFLEVACDGLTGAGLKPILVVLGHDRSRIEPKLPSGCTLVVNPAPERGQASSLAAGLSAALAAGREWALVALVDHPAVSAATIALLAAVAAEEPGAVHVPIHRGERGHPAAFPTSLAQAVAKANRNESAREVICRAGVPVREHPVEDSGILVDVDTPEELSRFRAREAAR